MRRSSRQTFENFIVGRANRAASLAAIETGRNPGRAYNPLFLHGGTGTGKSHLLHAIADRMVEVDPQIRTHVEGYAPFSRRMLRSIESGGVDEWHARMGDLDAILLDDCRGDAAWGRFQNEMIPLIDRFVTEGKQVILTAAHPPFQLQPIEERFVSRLQRGLIIPLAPPDNEMRRIMSMRLMEQSGAEIADEALDYLAEIPVQDPRELRGIVNRILIASHIEGETITRSWLIRTIGALVRGGEVRIDRVLPSEEPLFEVSFPERGRYRPAKERAPVREEEPASRPKPAAAEEGGPTPGTVAPREVSSGAVAEGGAGEQVEGAGAEDVRPQAGEEVPGEVVAARPETGTAGEGVGVVAPEPGVAREEEWVVEPEAVKEAGSAADTGQERPGEDEAGAAPVGEGKGEAGEGEEKEIGGRERPVDGESGGLILDWDRESDRLLNEL